MHLPIVSTLAMGAALLAVSPAFADAIVYRGIVGNSPILLELSEPAQSADGKLVGRYFYASNGVDIPLAARHVTKGTLDLDEEKPCTDKICHDAPDGQKPTPPVGAHWHLTVAAGGGYLSGTWTSAKGGKPLRLSLTMVNARPLPGDFDGTAQGLTSVVDGFTAGENELTTLNSPYDFMKFDEAHYAKGPPQAFDASTFSYWTDPRTKFAFPRITSLAGGADMSAANHYLEQQHWLNNTVALECESQIYQGFGWLEASGSDVGTLGGMDDASFTVNYLSPTILSYLDSGSPDCANAHPDDHADYYNLDVRTGKLLDLSLIFKGWVPTPNDDSSPKDLASARAKPGDYTWGPDKTLEAFVRANTPKDASAFGTPGDDSCTSDDLFASNLDITFVDGDKVRFAIDRLPYAVVACGGDLFDMPVAKLKDLLTPAAAEYFPSLASNGS